MGNLPSLKRLELIDLMLENEDAQTLLDQVCFYCCSTMSTLVLINTSKNICPLLHPGVFVNLQVHIIYFHIFKHKIIKFNKHNILKMYLHIIKN